MPVASQSALCHVAAEWPQASAVHVIEFVFCYTITTHDTHGSCRVTKD
jgi:hypothetical protein